MKKTVQLTIIIILLIVSIISSSLLTSAKSQTIKINTKALKETRKEIEIDIKIPVIKGMKNKELQNKFNAIFEEGIINLKEDVEEMAASYLKDAKEEGLSIHAYTVSTDYEVKYNRNNILSLVIDCYEYTGGAHGLYWKESFNIDLKTGELLTLRDLLRLNDNYEEIINNRIKAKIQESSNMYFKDGFNTIKEDQGFYLEGDDIVIYFELYEIAPYSTGMPEFRIPMALFK